MKSQYSILIQWSENDQCYVASFPEFGPYAKTHGGSYEEAFNNAQEVLELLLDEDVLLPKPNVYNAFVHNS